MAFKRSGVRLPLSPPVFSPIQSVSDFFVYLGRVFFARVVSDS